MKKILLLAFILLFAVSSQAAQITLDESVDSTLDGSAGDTTGEDTRLTLFGNDADQNTMNTEIYGHIGDTSNPHSVTATQIGVEEGATADQTGTEIQALIEALASLDLSGIGTLSLPKNTLVTVADDDDCTGQQYAIWYDIADDAFEYCENNSGAPTTLSTGGGGSSALTEVTYSDEACTADMLYSRASDGAILKCVATGNLDLVATLTDWSSPAPSIPTLSTAVLGTDGTTLTLTFSEAVTQGSGYADSQLDLDASTTGNDIGLTYSSGDGTTTHVYTAASQIESGETVDLDFDGTADSLESSTGGDLAAIVSASVTNNSTYSPSGPTFASNSIIPFLDDAIWGSLTLTNGWVNMTASARADTNDGDMPTQDAGTYTLVYDVRDDTASGDNIATVQFYDAGGGVNQLLSFNISATTIVPTGITTYGYIDLGGGEYRIWGYVAIATTGNRFLIDVNDGEDSQFGFGNVGLFSGELTSGEITALEATE